MISLGIDVSTKKIAVAGIRSNGSVVTRALELNPDHRGARRLVAARTTAYAALGGHAGEACIVVIEEPWHRHNSAPLLGVAYVVIEAAQASCPGAVVMDVKPASWKKDVLGHGRAGKDDALEFAERYGYAGGDDDIADALCLAQLGWDRWNRAAAA